jgi:hypothetical protein
MEERYRRIIFLPKDSPEDVKKMIDKLDKYGYITLIKDNMDSNELTYIIDGFIYSGGDALVLIKQLLKRIERQKIEKM